MCNMSLFIIVAQPLSLVALTGITFRVRKRRHLIYIYIIHLVYIIIMEYARSIPSNRINGLVYILLSMVEVVLPYCLAKYFQKNILWKTCFLYLLFGATTNGILQNTMLHLLPKIKADLFNDIYKAFSIYITFTHENIPGRGAVGAFVVMAIIYVGMAFIYKIFVEQDNEAHEKYYRIMYIFISAALILASVVLRSKIDMAGYGTVLFWLRIAPLIEATAVAMLMVFFAKIEKKHVKQKYNKIITRAREERGNSNKNIDIFTEEDINRFLNYKINQIKENGIAVDVILYLPDKISSPISQDKMIAEIDKVLNQILDSGSGKNRYIVIVFKREKNNLVINFEYSHKRYSIPVMLVKKREYMYVSDKSYRLEQYKSVRDEILLLYPNCFKENPL